MINALLIDKLSVRLYMEFQCGSSEMVVIQV